MEKKITYNKLLTNAVPQTGNELLKIWRLTGEHASKLKLTPPLLEEEVLLHAENLINLYPEFVNYRKLIAVMLNNVVWKQVVAGIPYDRRVLLLPKCLRNMSVCKAQFDELGLLCEQCGGCSINDITDIAESLGYHTIVSEGTTSVSALISSGQVECVIGVGCLDSFERSFPLAVREAVPSMAIPLFNCDCVDSVVDEEFFREILNIKQTNDWNGWINIDKLKHEVQSWFTKDKLNRLINQNDSTSQIAIRWLADEGKRWRPFIMAAVYNAITGNSDNLDDSLIKLAVSIECFHKASLVHDDIEDFDDERYDKPTIHKKYDIPIGINIGDILTGIGYKLIADCGMNDETKSKLITVASKAHTDLCIGQGEELLSRFNKKMPDRSGVINIFRYKTSPAFEVALKFGAITSENNNKTLEVLENYSKELGIAYQIKDDLDDFRNNAFLKNLKSFAPSVIAAIMSEKSADDTVNFINKFTEGDSEAVNELKSNKDFVKTIKETEDLLETYRLNTLRALKEISNSNLKILLYRLANRILK